MQTKPGVSGKDETGKTWFNPGQYEEQKEQLEEFEEQQNEDESELGFAQSTGQNLIGRTDLANQGEQDSTNTFEQQVYEALKRSPEVDISHVRVSANNEVVTLEGTVSHPKEARAVRNIVENIPHVKKVIDKLHVIQGTES